MNSFFGKPAVLSTACALLLCACEEPPLTVGHFLENDIARESMLVQCQSDQSIRYTDNCKNARSANERLQRIADVAREKERDAAYERAMEKIEVLRARERRMKEMRKAFEEISGAYIDPFTPPPRPVVPPRETTAAANTDSEPVIFGTPPGEAPLARSEIPPPVEVVQDPTVAAPAKDGTVDSAVSPSGANVEVLEQVELPEMPPAQNALDVELPEIPPPQDALDVELDRQLEQLQESESTGS